MKGRKVPCSRLLGPNLHLLILSGRPGVRKQGVVLKHGTSCSNLGNDIQLGGRTVFRFALSRRFALSSVTISAMVCAALRAACSPSLARVASRTGPTSFAPRSRARLCSCLTFSWELESPAPLHRGARRTPPVAVTRFALSPATIAVMVFVARATARSSSLVRTASRTGPTSAPRARASFRKCVTFSRILGSPTPLHQGARGMPHVAMTVTRTGACAGARAVVEARILQIALDKSAG